MKFRPKIGKGDFDTKVRHMQDFLADGHKVKVTLQFRGREMAHPELGSQILDAVIEQVGPHGKVETQARLEGRNMIDGAGSRQEGSRQEAARTKGCAQRQGRATRPSDSPTPAQQTGSREAEVRHRLTGSGPPESYERPTRPDRRRIDTEKESTMPKMKTSKTAAKRFKKTGTGKLRRLQQNRQHLFEKKPSTRTRRLDGMVDVHSGDAKKIKRLLGER